MFVNGINTDRWINESTNSARNIGRVLLYARAFMPLQQTVGGKHISGESLNRAL